MRYANDRTDAANQPMTRFELDQLFNLEAAMVWVEDGYMVDLSRCPEHSLRVEMEMRDFWDAVDPRTCACGAPVSNFTLDGTCLECRLSPFGSEWEHDRKERFAA